MPKNNLKMRLFALFFLAFLLKSPLAVGQNDCFGQLRREGLEQMNQKNYGKAILQFVAALVCPDRPTGHDLDEKIRLAVDRFSGLVESEKRSKKDLEATLLEVKKVNEALEEVNIDLVAATDAAVISAQNALEQGRRAEAMRLAELSDNSLRAGRKSDALTLAWLALRLGRGEKPTAAMLRNFGAAVRDSMTREVARFESSARNFRLLPDRKTALIEFENGAAELVSLENGSRKSLFSASTVAREIVILEKTPTRILAFSGLEAELFDGDGQKIATLKGHLEPIRFAAFSPDGSRLVTCARDNSARLFDGKGQFLKSLEGHAGNVYEAVFAADGSFLATRSSDGTARTWTRDGQFLAEIKSPMGGYLHDLAIFKNEKADLAAAFSDGSVRLFSRSGELVGEAFWAEKGPILKIETVGEPRFLAALVESASGDFGLFDSKTNKIEPILDEKGKPIRAARNLGEGFYWAQRDDFSLAIGSDEGRLGLVFNGLAGRLFSFDHFSANVFGFWLLATDERGATFLWLDDERQSQLLEWPATSSRPLAAYFSADETAIFTIQNDGRSLRKTPLPDHFLKTMDEKSGTFRPDAERLAREFGLQFLAEAFENN